MNALVYDPLYELSTDLQTLLRFRKSGWQSFCSYADDWSDFYFPRFLWGHFETLRYAQDKIDNTSGFCPVI